jgi:hypothetical protein
MEDQTYLAQILPKLKETMPYKWRVQSFNKNKPQATCVAYIDARDVMDRLDEVCTYGWHRNHEELKGLIYAGVGIILPSGKIMWRWDCGTESNTEAKKGESSDSFKRAAVNVGVGRFLYGLDIKYLDANEKKTSSNYPYVVDNKGKRVWDITKHINGPKPEKKESVVSTKDHTWEGDYKKEGAKQDTSLDVFSIAIQALTTKDSAHKWKKENQSAIDSLGADKGKVMTEYLNKVKELN